MILKCVRCVIESIVEAVSFFNRRREGSAGGFVPNGATSVPTILLALAMGGAGAANAQTATRYPIKHVIVIMQENRSFDHYFGTFPGADGIPPDTCVPLDQRNPGLGCVKPFHDQHDANAGGPHGPGSARADLGDGITTTKMDGFLYEQTHASQNCAPNTPACSGVKDGVDRHDAVGYHTREEIPNYWAYAEHFVLQDRLFEGMRSWSWPSHLELTSEWVATCTDPSKTSTCTTNPNGGKPTPDLKLPWSNLFQLLDVNGVSWKYYLGYGGEPDCEDDEMTCDPQLQSDGVPSIWNPSPYFAWVQAKGPTYLKYHNPRVEQLLSDVRNGKLPKVSWVVPAEDYSEHPSAGVTRGMEYVTSMVNAVMQSHYWKDTAIFIAWDDWGGFYDHVTPPNVDRSNTKGLIQGYGLRVPGIMISAYAKAGTIDHQVMSFDAYATFIEDIFMNGARLDPAALGNPDQRPDIRDALTHVTFPDGTEEPVGSLMAEFDFTQKPLPPLVLSTHIPTGITAICGSVNSEHCTQPTVTISWASVAAAKVPGPFVYHVKRGDVELPQCTGTATSCTDSPGPGVHLYRAYSVDSKGIRSPLSAAAEADEP
jgi:phospholipase C